MKPKFKIEVIENKHNSITYKVLIEKIITPFLYCFGLAKRYKAFRPLKQDQYERVVNSTYEFVLGYYQFCQLFQAERFIIFYKKFLETKTKNYKGYTFVPVIWKSTNYGPKIHYAIKKYGFYLTWQYGKYNKGYHVKSSIEDCKLYADEKTHTPKILETIDYEK